MRLSLQPLQGRDGKDRLMKLMNVPYHIYDINRGPMAPHALRIKTARAASTSDAAALGAQDVVDVVERAIEAVARAVSSLAAGERLRLKKASSAELLTSLAARTAQQEGDQFAQARLRGLEVWKKLRESAGGFLTGADVAAMLGMTSAAVHKRYKAHQLLGIREEKRRIVYPAFQFSDGRVVQHLPAVLQALTAEHVDERAQLRFLAGSHSRLDGRTPLCALRDGDLNSVLAAARAFGEHGAA